MCLPTIAEVERLEALGFYQETYRALNDRFNDWNYGVWEHRWWIATGQPCALCASLDPSIGVNRVSLCLGCLNEYPNTPWHPTGAVRPRTTALLHHALSCTSHSPPQIEPPPSYSEDTSGS